MPKYYSPKIKDYEIKVSPKGKYRTIFYKLGIKFPYFVGDKIRLDINLKKTDRSKEKLADTLSIYSKYPHYPNNEPQREKEIPVQGGIKEFILVSKIDYDPRAEISKAGQVTIYIVESGGGTPYNLFTADVYNDDNFYFFVVLPIITAIIAAGIAVVLTFVLMKFQR